MENTIIKDVMTPTPHSIGQDMPLKTAEDLMRKESIRHLPVRAGGELVGVVTDRDLKLALSFGDRETLKVEDVMTPDPFTAAPDRPLREVVEEMAKHKYGCTIVQDPLGKVVGIFTAVDALHLLREMLPGKREVS
jgi:acetoin utilization protein AcuB